MQQTLTGMGALAGGVGDLLAFWECGSEVGMDVLDRGSAAEEPGESVGVHPHTSNGEAYFILEGGATMTEDDETRILGVGDAEFCADGHTHSIKNHTDKPMRFLAVIFPNK